MTAVTAQMSVSLDGCYAGPKSQADPRDMAAWMEGPEGPGFFRVTRWVIDAMAWRERQGFAGGEQSVNSKIIEETFAAAGAYVLGRRMFDGGEIPWGDTPPFRAPVFVVTRRPREVLNRRGGTSFTFVTDGIELHIAPVLLGDGMRLFDATLGVGTHESIELTPVRVIEAPEVTHIRYAVGSRTRLELDDRGAGGG